MRASPASAGSTWQWAGLPAGSLVGEIERFASGTGCSGVFALPPGEYVIVSHLAPGGC